MNLTLSVDDEVLERARQGRVVAASFAELSALAE
jgi:hypothetical protein